MSDVRLSYHLPPLDPPAGRVKLLSSRKAALEAAIASRFMSARAAGTTADVKQLTAELRTVKNQLAVALGQRDGARCNVCGSDAWLSAKWWRDKTVCSGCLRKLKAGT
jgi:hypothetical protein